jgi:hypothetical protein
MASSGKSSIALLVLALFAAGLSLSAQTRQHVDNASIWQIQTTPFPRRGFLMTAVAAASATDVWALGSAAEHFDGAAWTAIPIVQTSSDPVSGNSTTLTGAAALSPADVWGVGGFQDSGGIVHPSIQHWDGAKWSVVPGFDNGAGLELTSVSALSPNDIWAAGWIVDSLCDCIQPLVEHWDGNKWAPATLPFLQGGSNFLLGISALSDSDVWAVGYLSLNGALNGAPISLHFDGTTWKAINPVSAQASLFNAVIALASNNVWAVGYGRQKTLIEQWNGSKWSVVSSPNNNQLNNFLNAITAVSANDLWAAGYSFQSSGMNKPLLLHWDGAQWSLNAAPGNGSNTLFGAAALPDGQVWLSGTLSTSHLPIFRPFILATAQGQ